MELSRAKLLVWSLLLLIAIALSCSRSPNSSIINENSKQRAIWNAGSIDRYVIDQSRVCECVMEPARLTVVNDSIVEAELLDRDGPFPKDFYRYYKTIDQLFDYIDQAAATDPVELEIEYDSSYGYPVRIWVDYESNVADDEMGIYTTLQYVMANMPVDRPLLLDSLMGDSAS